MTGPITLGLDVGTTNVKAAGFLEDGRVVAAASQSYPTYYPQRGWAEQRPADWEAAITTTLRELLTELGADAGRIVALGLSAHAPGLVPVDASGAPLLERIPIWQDERSRDQGERLLEEVGPDWVGLGMPFAAFAAKLKWFAETYPELARETQHALGIKAYLAGWLTGRHATDPSSEPGRIERWRRVCRACGWSLDQLPPVLPASEVVGELREELAREIGFRRPVPVVMGLNDGASATLGDGALQPGEAVITLATNGVIFLVSDRPISAETRLRHTLFCWPYVGPRWIIGGQTKAGAGCLQWLHGLFRDATGETFDIDRMLRECAEAPPGDNRVLFFPYLMGRGTPADDPSATGAFLGLTMRTNRADLTRAVLEGVAFSLREILNTFTGRGIEVSALSLTGGGARSELWRQITADVLQRPLRLSAGDSCLGAAMLASTGIGLHPTVEAAVERMQQETRTVHPHPESTGRYERIFREYLEKGDALYSSH